MKKYLTLILILGSLNAFGQSIQTITNKVSEKICDCMSADMQSYSDVKPEFNKCYDKVFNKIFSIADSTERKILVQPGALKKVKQRIIPTLNQNCEKIKELVDSKINSAKPSENAYPTNFTKKDFKKIKGWIGKITALKGEIVQIEKSSKNTPYLKVKIGDKEIWVLSMISGNFVKVGTNIKAVGYLIPLKNNSYESKFNKDKYQLLAFGIVNLKTGKLKYYMGSEQQVIQWKKGQIPSSGK